MSEKKINEDNPAIYELLFSLNEKGLQGIIKEVKENENLLSGIIVTVVEQRKQIDILQEHIKQLKKQNLR